MSTGHPFLAVIVLMAFAVASPSSEPQQVTLPAVLNSWADRQKRTRVLIAVKKQANIAAWEGRWDRCLAMDFCNLGGCADRARASGRHLVAVFFVPAR
jgi:hypothetical protein